jgi:hypothetical protein
MTKQSFTATNPQTGETVTVESSRKGITFLVFRTYADGSTGINLSTASDPVKASRTGHLRGSTAVAVPVS